MTSLCCSVDLDYIWKTTVLSLNVACGVKVYMIKWLQIGVILFNRHACACLFSRLIVTALDCLLTELNYRQFRAQIDVGEDPKNVSSYQRCGEINDEKGLTFYAKCDQPQSGRYVHLQGGFVYLHDDYLILCEVHIYGYLYRGECSVTRKCRH